MKKDSFNANEIPTDKGLSGNEKIEEAIAALQEEPSQELLAHTLTVIRRRMQEDGQFSVDRKSTRLNSSHKTESRMPSSA